MELCVLMVSTALHASAWMDFKVHPLFVSTVQSSVNKSHRKRTLSIFNKMLEFTIFSPILISYLFNWSSSLVDYFGDKIIYIIITGVHCMFRMQHIFAWPFRK
jgi:hypothetical protein